MSAAPDRLHGEEMEWPIAVPNFTRTDGAQLDLPRLVKQVSTYVEDIPHTGKPCSYFLGDGSRLYIDVGSRLETTTPESLSFEWTFANGIGKERMVRAMLDTVVCDENGRETPLGPYSLNKRVIAEKDDDAGSRTPGFGAHESYNTTRQAVHDRDHVGAQDIQSSRLALLGIHMATRGVLVGVGGLYVDGSYVIAQKASIATDDYNTGTTSIKPVVNMRNEAHADASKWARLHMVLGDANMSPWAHKMKLATTSMVIRLVENGVELPELQFRDSLAKNSREIARDPTLRTTVAMENGEALTGLEIQLRLALAATALSREITLPDEELWALEEWTKVCRDMAQNPLLARERVEWVLKRQLLERFAETQGLQWTDVRMRQQERRWDKIADNGIGMHFRQTRWSQWMPPESMIVNSMVQPPQNTRAAIRGRFVQTFDRVVTAGVYTDWGSVNPGTGTIRLDNPFATYNQDVENAIAKHLAAQQMAS